MNTYDVALQFLNRAEKMDDERADVNADIRIDLSVTHYFLGRLDSALFYVNEALKFKRDPSFMVNKGFYLMKLDSIDAGCAMLKQADLMGAKIDETYDAEHEVQKLRKKYCGN